MENETWEAKVARIEAAVVGKYFTDAARICAEAGMISRVCIVDGVGRLVQSNFRADRVGLVVDNGIVTATRTG